MMRDRWKTTQSGEYLGKLETIVPFKGANPLLIFLQSFPCGNADPMGLCLLIFQEKSGIQILYIIS